MKRLFLCVFLLCLAPSLGAWSTHKFYVAVFQMDYVAKKKVLQVTSRIFIDDLEAALFKKYGKKFYLGESRELDDTNDYLKKYFSENVKVSVNGKSIPLTFLGKETEDDIILCYYTLPAKNVVKKISVKNTTLLESFKDQQNIIHININNNRKSLLLTIGEQQGSLQF